MNSDRGFRQQNVFPALPPPLFSLSAEATDFHAPRAGRSRAGRFAKSLHGPFQYLALMILAGFVVLLCLVRFKDQPIEGMGERSIAALHVTDMAGKPVRLDDGSGAVTLVSLWFAECLPCIKEVPALNEIAADFRHEKVRFVAVTFDSPDVAREFAARHGLELPLAFAGLGHLTEVAGVDGVLTFPRILIYGHDGRLMRAYRNTFQSTLEGALQAALDRRHEGA